VAMANLVGILSLVLYLSLSSNLIFYCQINIYSDSPNLSSNPKLCIHIHEARSKLQHNFNKLITSIFIQFKSKVLKIFRLNMVLRVLIYRYLTVFGFLKILLIKKTIPNNHRKKIRFGIEKNYLRRNLLSNKNGLITEII
jgi:hypothetical protein